MLYFLTIFFETVFDNIKTVKPLKKSRNERNT